MSRHPHVIIVISSTLTGASDICDPSNVALADNGAICKSSSDLGNHRCEMAIDGIPEPGDKTEWAADGEGVGSWLLVMFDQKYE